jgi:nicotinate-nucleotide adenylyltransferase
MRVGIFGGTFDPIHIGHLVLAEQCREQCQLDEVWFVPAAQPPHKRDAVISPAKARCEMIEFAISGQPQFQLCTAEIDRAGPSFTVTTLEQLHSKHPDHELFLLIGADSLRDLPLWREPRKILELATVVAVNRGGRPEPDRTMINDRLGSDIHSRLRFVEMPGIDVSASDIRRRVASGRSIRYLVPRAVETFIHQRNLFVAPAVEA